MLRVSVCILSISENVIPGVDVRNKIFNCISIGSKSLLRTFQFVSLEPLLVNVEAESSVKHYMYSTGLYLQLGLKLATLSHLVEFAFSKEIHRNSGQFILRVY